MRNQLLLTLLITVLAFTSFVSDSRGQCYGTPGCERPERDVVTPTKWPDAVDQIRCMYLQTAMELG